MTPPPERSSSSSSAAHDAFDFDASLRFLDDLDASAELLPPPCDVEDVDTQRLLQELALQDQLPFSPDDLLPLSPKAEQQEQEQQGDAARSKTTTPPPAPRATKAVSSMTPVGSSSSSSSTSTGRMRPKEEMELLRAQVEELEAELERIKQLQSKAEPERDVPQSRTEDAVWERIAERQQEAKRRAEIENVKLREMVEGQLRLVKSLEKLLRKRPNAALADASCDVLRTGDRKRSRVTTAVDVEALYESIRPRIELQRDEVDRLFRELGLDQIDVDMDDGTAKVDDDTNTIFMDYQVVKVMPFALATTSDAVWSCLTVPHMELPNGHYGATIESSGDTARIQFTIDMKQRRTVACVRVFGLGKRYDEEGRHIFVWESIGFADGPLVGGDCNMRLRERGLITVERSKTSPSSAIVRSNVRLVPISEKDSAHHGSRVSTLLDMCIGSFNQNVKVMTQFIENQLLEASMQTGSAKSNTSTR
ncbi:hypothetical protein PINS_up012568 [Pythium insidiosum]|nr:hypothetical protein PINS_up012568 [Pythium insidiosum]